MFPFSRIVCLTEETVETLYLLGEQDRIVGVSGYVVRPPEARRDKPRVSAFTSANVPKILELKPDLVLAFSDMQAEIVAELIRAGVEVHAFNQRTVAGILDMIRFLGAMVGCAQKADHLADQFKAALDTAYAQGRRLAQRSKVFFEEWDEPLISTIGWVSELVEIAGGEEIFADRAIGAAAKERIVQIDDVIARKPDLMIGSWCGKKFSPDKVRARAGFSAVPAVKSGTLHEVKSSIILQPGPAALTDGLKALQKIIGDWAPA